MTMICWVYDVQLAEDSNEEEREGLEERREVWTLLTHLHPNSARERDEEEDGEEEDDPPPPYTKKRLVC